MRVLDLSQDFSMHTPAFASYDGPSIKWVKRLAFDKVGGQEITSTLHVGTHLDGPVHFWSAGRTIGELPPPLPATPGSDRAPKEFRPDPEAIPTDAEREALKPASVH